MGRIALALALLIFYFVITFPVFALDVSVSQSNLSKYYFGGEYFVYKMVLTPNSTKDSKLLDGKEYVLLTRLTSSGIFVEVHTNDGLEIFHPLPQDYYKIINNTCVLKFYLPKNKGVSNISVKVVGFVPGSSSRLSNLSILDVLIGKESVFEKKVIVVNRQKFLSDIKSLEEEQLTPDQKKMVDEALMLYNIGEYLKANALIEKIEKNILEYKFKKEEAVLNDLLDNLKDDLNNLKNQLTVIRTKLEIEKNKLENYGYLKSQEEKLQIKITDVSSKLDAAKELIRAGKLDEAKNKLKLVKQSLDDLKVSVAKLSIELNSAKKKTTNLINWPYVLVAILGAAGLVAFLYFRRRRSF